MPVPAAVVIVIIVVAAEAKRLLGSAVGQDAVAADPEVRLVAVQGAAVEAAVVAGHLQRPSVRGGGAGAPLHEREPVVGPVGEREHRGPVHVEQFHRGGRVPGQAGVGPRDAEAGVGSVAPPGEVGEGLRDLGRRLVPPPRFRETRRAGVERPLPVVDAVLRGGGVAPERTAGDLAAESGGVEAVGELEGEGAAEGVQAVGGVGPGAELHPVDRELREQVELHGVAERLVDADAVLVDGDALRQAEQRRCRKAAEAQRRLEGIRGRALQGHRAEALVEGVGHRGRPARRQVAPVDHRDGRRHARAVDAGAGDGGDGHHVDPLCEGPDRQRHVEHVRAPGR